MSDDRSAARTQVKSAGRALDLLETLARYKEGLTFTDLVKETELPKSSLYELLGLMTDRGFLEIEDESRRYALGIKTWEVGHAFVRHRQLVEVAVEEMEGIVSSINETSQLSVLDGLENLYLGKVDCTHPLRLATDVGKRFPAYATALGKVLLAYLPPKELSRRLESAELRPVTDNTVTDVAELQKELGRTRSRSFGVDWEEGMAGLRCIAVPIRSHDQVIAAVSVSVPVFRATQPQMTGAIKLLASASLVISRKLGTVEEDPGLLRLLSMPDQELGALYEETRTVRDPVEGLPS